MSECHSRLPNIAPTGAAIVPAVVVAVTEVAVCVVIRGLVYL